MGQQEGQELEQGPGNGPMEQDRAVMTRLCHSTESTLPAAPAQDKPWCQTGILVQLIQRGERLPKASTALAAQVSAGRLQDRIQHPARHSNSSKQDLGPWDVSQPCLEQKEEHRCPWSQLERVMVNPAQPGAR